jgi:ATP-dependent DNA helicase PIF1
METLSEDQQKAIDLIKERRNIFITGSAGTGKSYLLKFLKQTIHKIHLTASTGIASVNIGGVTIHSWAGIGLGTIPVDKIKFSEKVKSRIRCAKILAIDEISMISAETFDMVNDAMKIIRNNDKPFGDIQLIIFGDFFQLSPVNGDFCFNSRSWKEADFIPIILKQVFRQSDDNFIKLLNNIRYANIDDDTISALTERIGLKYDSVIEPTILVSHNEQANRINNENMEKIDGKKYTFKAKYMGRDQTKLEFLKKNCVAYDILELKVGTRVMMLKNTYSTQGIINGSVGIVKEINVFPTVQFENGEIVSIQPELWALERYDDSEDKVIVEASMEQIPLICSWAITIHKSQGMTLNKIRCNLSKVFTYGQSYVALSRVKSLEGLFIDEIDFDKIRTSSMIIEFYNNLACP